MADINMTEAYKKANSFVNDNMEKWIKEYSLTEDQVAAIYETMKACEYLDVDITSMEGWELV